MGHLSVTNALVTYAHIFGISAGMRKQEQNKKQLFHLPGWGLGY